MIRIGGMPIPPPQILGASDAVADKLDRMYAAYVAEYDRWDWRARERKRGSPYELIRNTSPENDIIDDSWMEIITFTKRECENLAQIQNWLETFRGRAAMKAGLGVQG